MPTLQRRFLVFGLVMVVLVGGSPRLFGDEKDEPSFKGKRLSAWIADLDDENYKVRLTAAFTIAGMGPKAVKAVSPLTRSLRDKVPAVRAMAAGALSKIGPGAKAAVPALAEGVRDEIATVRRLCVNALGRIGADTKEAVNALADALKDRDAEVRGSAAVALEKIGSGAKSALPALLDAMAEKDPFVGLDVSETIVALVPHYPGDARTVLLQHLLHKDPEVQLYAARAIVRVSPAARKDALKFLTNALKDDNPKVREFAAGQLGQLGSLAAPALASLKTAAKDGNEKVRQAAAAAVQRVKEDKSPPAAPSKEPLRKDKPLRVWIAQLKDKSEKARLEAVRELGEVGEEAIAPLVVAIKELDSNETSRLYAALALGRIGKNAVPTLEIALKSWDDRLLEAVGHALGEIGPDAKTAVPGLIALMRKKSGSSLASSVIPEALGKIGKPAVAPLVAVLNGDDLRETDLVTQDALRALGGMRADAKSAIPAVLRVLKGGGFPLRIAAARSLGKISPGTGVKEVVPALVAALQDKNEFVRKEAATALGNLGPSAKEAIPALVDLLSEGRPTGFARANVGGAASEALGKMGKDAVTHLIKALKSRDTDVRVGAAYALAGIKAEASGATVALTAALEDRDAGVRAAAIYALGQIGPDAKSALPAIKRLMKDKEESVRKAAAEALKQLDTDAKK